MKKEALELAKLGFNGRTPRDRKESTVEAARRAQVTNFHYLRACLFLRVTQSHPWQFRALQQS